MEELPISRYRNRSADLNSVPGLDAWPPTTRNRAPGDGDTSVRVQSPYETCYDVAHGYSAERAIVQP